MYDVSSEYLKAVSKPDREFKILVHFDFKDGSQADFDDHTILNDVEIASQAIAGSANSDKIDIGAAIAAKATLTVIDDNISLHRYTGAAFSICTSLKLENGEFEEVPMGRFWVDASKLSRIGNKISIVGYDSMMSLMYALSDAHRQQLKNQTAEQAVQFLAAYSNCGFEQDLSELPNNNIPLDFDSPQIETARDGVMWIAQLMGCFAHVSRLGFLEFVPIKSEWVYYNDEHTLGTIIAVRNIQGSERYKTRFADDRIHVVGLSMPDSNNKLVTRTVGGLEGDANITVELEKNPLVVNSSLSLRDILGAILTQVRTTYFYAFKTEIINDPALDAGDTIRLQGGIIHGTNKNNDLIGFITHNVWRYRGHHEITNAGQCPIVYAEGGETAVASLESDAVNLTADEDLDELYYLPPKSQAEKAAAGNGHSDRIITTQIGHGAYSISALTVENFYTETTSGTVSGLSGYMRGGTKPYFMLGMDYNSSLSLVCMYSNNDWATLEIAPGRLRYRSYQARTDGEDYNIELDLLDGGSGGVEKEYVDTQDESYFEKSKKYTDNAVNTVADSVTQLGSSLTTTNNKVQTNTTDIAELRGDLNELQSEYAYTTGIAFKSGGFALTFADKNGETFVNEFEVTETNGKISKITNITAGKEITVTYE